MKKNKKIILISAVAVVLIAAIIIVLALTGVLGGNKKNKKDNPLQEHAEDVDAEVFELTSVTDFEDLTKALKKLEVLNDGIYIEVSGEDLREILSDLNETYALEELSGLGIDTSVLFEEEFDDLDSVNIYIRTNLFVAEEDKDFGYIVTFCTNYTSEELAIESFKSVDDLSMLFRMYGLNLKKLSDDEYYFSEKKGLGHLTLNINIGEIIDVIADESGIGADTIKDNIKDMKIDPYTLGNFVSSFNLEDKQVVFGTAYGEEYIDELDDVFAKYDYAEPSSVETSSEIYTCIYKMIRSVFLLANMGH